MDLNEFVSDVLQQLLGGIQKAQGAIQQKGEINPKLRRVSNDITARSYSDRSIHMIDFDVAVTVVQSSETTGGMGLFVGPVGLGTKGQSNAENSTVSRIRFQVPITYPVAPDKQDEHKP